MGDDMPKITFEEWANRIESRLSKLEDAMDTVFAALKGNKERELMFFAEIAKDDPEIGAHLNAMRERVMSYPTDIPDVS